MRGSGFAVPKELGDREDIEGVLDAVLAEHVACGARPGIGDQATR